MSLPDLRRSAESPGIPFFSVFCRAGIVTWLLGSKGARFPFQRGPRDAGSAV